MHKTLNKHRIKANFPRSVAQAAGIALPNATTKRPTDVVNLYYVTPFSKYLGTFSIL